MSADCWTKKLADKSVPVRLMGAYRLAQMKGPDAAKARDAFAQYAGDKDLVVRNAILFDSGGLATRASFLRLPRQKRRMRSV